MKQQARNPRASQSNWVGVQLIHLKPNVYRTAEISSLCISLNFALLSSDIVIMQLHFSSFDYETEILYQEGFFVFLCKFLTLLGFLIFVSSSWNEMKNVCSQYDRHGTKTAGSHSKIMAPCKVQTPTLLTTLSSYDLTSLLIFQLKSEAGSASSSEPLSSPSLSFSFTSWLFSSSVSIKRASLFKQWRYFCVCSQCFRKRWPRFCEPRIELKGVGWVVFRLPITKVDISG